MRTLLSLVLFFQLCIIGRCNEGKLEEIKLIRRAYIDVVGVLPTVAEMEWFTVYTKGGYEMAVNFLIQKKSLKEQEQLKCRLLSNDYKKDNTRLLSIEEIMSIFLYLSGKKLGDISFSQAKQHLADNAVLCSSSTTEAIEYLCNALLCRDCNLQEANIIEKYIRDSNDSKDMWLSVIDIITNFDAFKHK